jgi:hypothetical protein
MLPDPGCYEERYRLTRPARILASAFLSLVLGVLWHQQLIFAVLTVLLAVPAVLALVLRPVAFRADYAGITLGSDRLLPHRPAVFIPWTDVENIIFYPRPTSSVDQARYIGVQRRDGAPALPYGNKQAPGCPVPGVVAGATRRIKSWRLDRDRLAALTAAVAPGVPIIEAGTGPNQGVAGPGQASPVDR